METPRTVRVLLASILALLPAAPLSAGRFVRGDLDGSREVDISDPVGLLGHLFLGVPLPHACPDAADADDTGELDLSDGIYLLNHLFLGGNRPLEPFPSCGLDPTRDALDCQGFPDCFCGGFAGFPCDDGELCDQIEGACNGADLPGECVRAPEACEKIFDPVCGCDGVTYDNDCERLRAGAQKDHHGECLAKKVCGGIRGLPCEAEEICELPPGSCDVLDQEGECLPRPGGCPDVFEPVCGCDGVTYGNDCDRMMAGVQKDHDGECAPKNICGGILGTPCAKGELCDLPPGSCDGADFQGECVTIQEGCPRIFDPVCGCDGVTYANDCERIRAEVQKDHDGECVVTMPCGVRGGVECPDGTFCDFPDGTCGAADEPGECRPRAEACPAIFDPVCGCDGVTYSSDCVRSAAGVSRLHAGPCEEQN